MLRRRNSSGDEGWLMQEVEESRSEKLVMVQFQGRCARTGEKAKQGGAGNLYRYGRKKTKMAPVVEVGWEAHRQSQGMK